MLVYQEAKDRLKSMVASTEEPILSDTILEDLMRLARVADRFGTAPDAYQIWYANYSYSVGDLVVATQRGAGTKASITSTLYIPPVQPYVASIVWEMQSGSGTHTSGATEPAWPTSATPGVTTVIDNAGADQIVWVANSTTPWFGAWDLALAASEGWRRKAGLIANGYRFSDQGKDVRRDQIFDHCLTMVKEYNKKCLASYSMHKGTALEYRYGRLIPGVETNWD